MNRPRRRAFVLVLALVALASAGTTLAAAARRVARRVLEASRRADELQWKWAHTSCRTYVLPLASHLIAREEAAGRPDVVCAVRRLRLGELKIRLIASDEQRKANVNALSALRPKDVAQRLESLQALQQTARRIELRPSKPPPGVINRYPQCYGAYGQVFRFEHPSELLSERLDGTSADRITCWGSGKVNVRGAPADVVRVMVEGVLDEVQLDKLLRAVRPRHEGESGGGNAPASLEQILARLDLPHGTPRRVAERLTDTSTCHALWIVARGRTRSFHRLDVRSAGDTENDSQSWSFAW